MTTSTDRPAAPARTAPSRYRTVDLLVTVGIGVIFGVAFLGWGQMYTLIAPLSAGFKPIEGLLAGFWFLPGVLAGLVVRKPGAALLAGLLAAVLSAMIGSQWAWGAVISGLVQGGGAEIGFLLARYRRFTVPVAVLAGLVAAVAEWGWEKLAYYPEMSWPFSLAMLAFFLISGAVICGLLAPALVRALVSAGALDALPAGRDRAEARRV